jgi:hypothetical protein
VLLVSHGRYTVWETLKESVVEYVNFPKEESFGDDINREDKER